MTQASLSDRVLDCIKCHPGASTRYVRSNVNARHDDARAAMRELEAAGTIVNRGTGARCRWYLADEHSDVPPAPPGYVRGKITAAVATANGIEWRRYHPDEAVREQRFEEALRSIADDVRGRATVSDAPAHTMSEMLSVYPWGDPHIDMRAWSRECGEEWNLEIAEASFRRAFSYVVSMAPPSRRALLLIVGDTWHANDRTARTPRSKHQLDVSCTPGEADIVIVRLKRWAIELLKSKHEHVDVSFRPGNHDPDRTRACATIFQSFYEDDPRVTMHDAYEPHWRMRHGTNLIASTHGDSGKPLDWVLGAAAAWPDDWAATRNRIYITGHVHHEQVKQYPGMTVRTLNTIAPRDKHAAQHPYHPQREMIALHMHERLGKVAETSYDLRLHEAG